VLNHKARAFYRRHQVRDIEPAAESGLAMQGRVVMTTRYCGTRHSPLGGDRRTDHLFPTTSIYSRTRVDAGCQNHRIVRRWVRVFLDILFHRSRIETGFAASKARSRSTGARASNSTQQVAETSPMWRQRSAAKRSPPAWSTLAGSRRRPRYIACCRSTC